MCIELMDDSTSALPPRRVKFLFWLILGSFSVFFAEVVSGSSMFPYFTAWGLVAVMPLYTLHILVLSYAVFSRGRPGFSALFIAGAVFGMYEAYITKVLWNPTWGPPVVSVFGLAGVEAVILVLWWHPIMAFIIPLLAAESALTRSREVAGALHSRFGQLFSSGTEKHMMLLALSGGLLQSANSPSPAYSLLSGASTTAFLLLLIYIWERTKGTGYTLRQLLPSRREFRVLFALLMALYAVMGVFLRPDALPGLFPQLIIWLMYAVLFALLYLSLKSSLKPLPANPPARFPWRTGLLLAVTFTLVSAISTAAHTGIFAMAAMWVVGGITGIWLLVQSVESSIVQLRS